MKLLLAGFVLLTSTIASAAQEDLSQACASVEKAEYACSIQTVRKIADAREATLGLFMNYNDSQTLGETVCIVHSEVPDMDSTSSAEVITFYSPNNLRVDGYTILSDKFNRNVSHKVKFSNKKWKFQSTLWNWFGDAEKRNLEINLEDMSLKGDDEFGNRNISMIKAKHSGNCVPVRN